FGTIDTPVAPAVTLVGMTGLSFCLALVGFLVAGVVESATPVARRTASKRAALRTLVLPGAALVGVSAALVVPAVFPYTVEETGTATVAVVQGNVPGPGNNILYD